MRISLIYPGLTVSERYGVDIGDAGGRQAPLGILYLAAYLRQRGHCLQLIDAEAEELSNEEVCARLAAFSPQITGISMTTVAAASAKALAREIRSCRPGMPIVCGGPHVTADPADAMAELSFSFGIIGEGEEAFAEFLDYPDAPERWPDIGNLLWRNKSGELVVNPRRPAIADLDELPYPARDLLPDVRIYRPPIGCYQADFTASVVSSRGCPYGCIFCDNNTFGRRVRFFSPEYLVGEIEFLISEFGVREISFLDDTFPCRRSRIDAILDLLEERDLRFIWTCMANVNDLDADLLRRMRKAGCWQIALGVESGNDRILDLIGKGISTAKVREVVNAVHAAGIQAKGFFMLGHPAETLETLRETVELALELPFTDIVCTLATPIRGTRFYEMADSGDYGNFERDATSSRMNYWEPVFVPSGLSADTLYQTQRDLYRRFYLRPGIICRQLFKFRRPRNMARALATAMKILSVKAKTTH